MKGDVEAGSLWAGQAVGLVRRLATAAEIVDEMMSEAQVVLAGLSP